MNDKRVFARGARLLAFSACFLIGLQVSIAHANSECDSGVVQRISQSNKAQTAFRQNAMQQVIVPPPAPSMIANTPCHSKELQRVADKFASAPGDMMGQMTGGLGGGSDPISGIMNKFFEAGMTSINSAAENIPGMLNFQQLASDQLSGLLGNLGLGDAFSTELCGMMVDMVVNFLECQFPLEIPEMPSFDIGLGSLNDLMPQGCAGNAMREALYAADSAGAWDMISQPFSVNNGQIQPGNAQQYNATRGSQ